MNVDFNDCPWNDACLIMPRHGVWTEWNEAAIRKMCCQNQEQIFICTVEDTINGRSSMTQEKYVLESKQQKGNQHAKELGCEVKLAIGMKVMVTQNIETDLDITNGARGKIVDIILDPDEPVHHKNSSLVKLEKLPFYFLVKLEHTQARHLWGLSPNMIPIQPQFIRHNIKIIEKDGHTSQKTVV